MDLYSMQLRSPAARDIVGTTIALAGIGSAFEAQFEWELHQRGEIVASGGFMHGQMGPLSAFAQEISLEGVKGLRAGKATLVLNGWNVGEDNPHEPEATVEVIVIPGAEGFVPYQVKKGDTVSQIIADADFKSAITTVAHVALASALADANKIRPGQILRLPV